MISEPLNLEIRNRLIQGKPLDGLPLEMRDGRADLRGLELPDPSVVRRFQVHGVPMAEIDSSTVIRAAKWWNLDFTGSKLSALRLFGCQINNCRFDYCQLQDLRLWSTKVSDTSFNGANLRMAALGGVQDGCRNSFVNVDFTEADLRQTKYTAASFDRCVFRNAKLEKIDFQSSTFVDCLFEGKLSDVLFYRRGFKGESFPPNEMLNVDFTKAKLHDVGFRNLKLDKVRFPADADHVVIKNFASALDQMSEALQRQEDITAKKLVAFMQIHRNWAGPDQVQGVINLEDLAEVVGEEGVKRFVAVIPR